MARLVRHEETSPIKIDPATWPRDENGNLKTIFICACGISSKFPFCDGTHKGCKGEEVGKVPQMLVRLADNYEMDLEVSVGRFVAMLEPFMMLILGGLVGYVLIAIFLPVYSLLDAM